MLAVIRPFLEDHRDPSLVEFLEWLAFNGTGPENPSFHKQLREPWHAADLFDPRCPLTPATLIAVGPNTRNGAPIDTSFAGLLAVTSPLEEVCTVRTLVRHPRAKVVGGDPAPDTFGPEYGEKLYVFKNIDMLPATPA
mmetsp:Transcript_42675/g.136706  ORF Transcript_42675/g.136706 Transcript_42675/m.136706 type:complete len:138 (+) Transcript_42675:259-672(+)